MVVLLFKYCFTSQLDLPKPVLVLVLSARKSSTNISFSIIPVNLFMRKWKDIEITVCQIILTKNHCLAKTWDLYVFVCPGGDWQRDVHH